jgi:hypothetical protein
MNRVSFLDVLILNRNLKSVTDRLFDNFIDNRHINIIGVIDSGSRDEEVSANTVVRDASIEALLHGLRINRGFNLGINWWRNQPTESSFLLLLPNDTELIEFDIDGLIRGLEGFRNIAAILPLSQNSPYTEILPESRLGLVWSINEGPILLSRKYVDFQSKCSSLVFDDNNFRGYLTFTELAIKSYANNFGILATDFISFRENESYLQTKHQLIGTEPLEDNARLLLDEGRVWLARKYGLSDGRSFELIARLLFEEYLRVHPEEHDKYIK